MTWTLGRGSYATYLAVVFVLISAYAIAQTAIPTTPAGKILGAWLSAYNLGDAGQLEQFRNTYSFTPTVDATLKTRQYIGPLVLVRIENSAPLAISALLAGTESDILVRRTFNASADNPVKIAATKFEIIPRPADLAIPRMTQAGALEALSKRADEFVAQDRFSGAMLIARHGEILFEKTWGFANREFRAPITRNSKFRLGSANKMFTAVAVLQLIQEGKLSLDGTIGSYIADYPNKEIASKVTVRELLTHTGGTGDIFGPDYDSHREALKTHADYVALYGSRGPQFEPGTKDAYSNYGFVLLGALIEKVTGTSYYDYVRDHVFRPAGMTDTDSLPEAVDVPDRTTGYMRQGTGWKTNSDWLPYRGMAAGGGYSTLGDLLKFANALQAGRLLPKSVLIEATKPQNHEGWYGYGFQVQGEGEFINYGHDGGAPGMNAEIRIFPKLDTVVIALSNLDPPVAERLAEFYLWRMPGATP